MKLKTFFKTNLFAIAMMVGGVSTWAQVNIIPVRTDVTGFTNWTDTGVTGTNYIQLLTATSVTVSPTMNFNSFTAETLNFKARTYGGVVTGENDVFVAISTDNGSTWTDIGARTPTSSSLTAMTSFDLRSFNGTQVKVKFYVKGISNNLGVGIDDVTFSGIAVTCSTPNLAFATVTYNKTEGDASFTQTATTLNETTSIAYSSSAPTIAAVNTTTGEITIGNAGSAIITATQIAGTHNTVDYCEALATYTINVAAVPCNSSNLTFTTSILNKIVGDATFTQTAITLNTASPIIYSSSAPAVAAVDASTGAITLGIAGSAIITANQTRSDGFCVATAVYTIYLNSKIPSIAVTDITSMDFTANVASTDTKTITVGGTRLTADIGLVLSGANANLFSLSFSSLAQLGGNAGNTFVTITYSPIIAGNHAATLTFYSTGATSVSLSLTGTATGTSGIFNPYSSLAVSVENGSILLSSEGGEIVEVFNTIGQKLFSKLTVAGINVIKVNENGVVIVKVRNLASKVILK